MTPITLRHDEFSELTTTSEADARVVSAAPQPTTAIADVVQFVMRGPGVALVPRGFEELGAVVAEIERDPSFREEMKQARSWVAENVLKGESLTLRKLRLMRGMSQAQLADEIGTQQPHIARIESGRADLRLETCRRMARALGIDLNTLDQALQRQGVPDS